MKIAYLTQYDATNIRSWSGSGYNIANCLSGQGADVQFIGPLKNIKQLANGLKYIANHVLLRFNDHPQRDPAFLKSYGQQATDILKTSDADIVLAPGGLPLSYLQTDLPTVLWTDCTFASMKDYYPAFKGLSQRTIRNGHAGELKALRNCSRLIFTSNWAASSAISDYGADPETVDIIPFGSNMLAAASQDEIEELIAERIARMGQRIQLFCSGVDWYRKGIDIALAVVDHLVNTGLPCELVIAGCLPPKGVVLPDYVKIAGFIAKDNAQGLRTLSDYYRSSHLFVLPTRAECFGLVFAEAASFALPSVATETGGTRTAMDDERCGRLLAPEASVSLWAETIRALFATPDTYAMACRSAYAAYRNRLNWVKAGEAIMPILEKLVAERMRERS